MALYKVFDLKNGAIAKFIKVTDIRIISKSMIYFSIKTFSSLFHKNNGDFLSFKKIEVYQNEPDYNEYFSENIVKDSGKSFTSQIYLYLMDKKNMDGTDFTDSVFSGTEEERDELTPFESLKFFNEDTETMQIYINNSWGNE